MKKKLFKIVTLGCSKNTVDSEVLIRQIKLNGGEVVWNDNDFAENVIINTCSFIEDAKIESLETINYYLWLKKQAKIKHIYIFGCLSQRYREILKMEYPEVEGVFGTEDYKSVLEALKMKYFPKHLKEREVTTGPVTAYLKIAEGCNRNCSFCAIPYIRGRHKSKRMEDLLDEAKYLSDKGIKEIILISQDLNYYGVDSKNRQLLPELVNKLAELNLFKWIRLQYLHPAGFPMELLEVIKENKNVCNYIDIPIQHISDKMLKLMNRGINKKQTEKVLYAIREKIPGVSIRTTVLLGHPGETLKEYHELKNFLKKFKFDKVGGFTYSHEDHTPAFDNLKDNVSKASKSKRLSAIMKMQEEIALEKNKKFVGKQLEILIEDFVNGVYVGRTEYDSPEVDNEVLIKSDSNLILGNWYKVRIYDVSSYYLEGLVE